MNYNWEATIKVFRYARWQLLQRVFWHNSAMGGKRRIFANYLRETLYKALHDKPRSL